MLEATNGKRATAVTDEGDAKDLAHDVGYLALALEQATAYIGVKTISLATYRKRWQAREAKVRTWYDKQLMQYPKSVAVAWDTTFEELSPAARALLRLLCWLAPDPIPRVLLETEKANEVLNERSKLGDEAGIATMEDSLAELASYSLLKWDADSKAASIHRLVQEVTQDQISKELQQDYIRAMLAIVDDYIPADPPPQDVRSWPLWERLRTHVAAILRAADAADIAAPTTRLMNDLGSLLMSKNIWHETESQYRRALAIDEASYGAEHPKLAIRLNNLALLLKATNRLAEAEPLMRRAVEISLGFFVSTGHHHPNEAPIIGHYRSLLEAMDYTPERIDARLNEIIALFGVTFGNNT